MLSPLPAIAAGPDGAQSLVRRGFADIEAGCFWLEQDISSDAADAAAIAKRLADKGFTTTASGSRFELARGTTRGLLWVEKRGDGAVASTCFFEQTHRRVCQPTCAALAERGK